MQSLTKEERAKKFSTTNKDVGLRSRGHRKLNPTEQKELFDNLAGDSPAAKLINLRILREATQSSKAEHHDSEFEQKIYGASIKESISQRQYEALPHMLGHMASISIDPEWNELLVISLSNSRQFHQAFLRSKKPSELMYVSSLNNWDLPLWQKLQSQQKSATASSLMEQVRKDFEEFHAKTKESLRHPNRSTNRSTKVNVGGG